MRYSMRRVLLVVVSCLAAGAILFITCSILRRNSKRFQNYQSWSADIEFLIEPDALHTDRSALVCVTSDTKDLKRRQAIRETWGTTPWMQVVFVMGVPQGPGASQYQKTLIGEGKLYNDVIQVDINEHYNNATLKSMALVQWAARVTRSIGYRIIIKVYDDLFINTPLLFSYMDHFTNGNLYGLYHKNVNVQRCTKANCNKWSLRKDEYFPDVYPPYLDGMFYVFTEDALYQINDHLFEPEFITVEDVYITGLVSARAGVSRMAIPEGIQIETRSPDNKTTAALNKSILAQSNCNPELQKDYWNIVLPNLYHSG